MAFFAMLWRKRRLINPPKDPLQGDALTPSDELYGRPREPDARLSDRRIAQTAFLWRVSVVKWLCVCRMVVLFVRGASIGAYARFDLFWCLFWWCLGFWGGGFGWSIALWWCAVARAEKA